MSSRFTSSSTAKTAATHPSIIAKTPPIPTTNPVISAFAKVNLRQYITRNGKFRILGSSATFGTPQFSNYLKAAQIPTKLHASSAYSVAIMTLLLRSEGFFCVVPPQQYAPTLHTWVDLVAYFEYAHSLAKMGEDALEKRRFRQSLLLPESSTNNNNKSSEQQQKPEQESNLPPPPVYNNWMDVIPPNVAIHSPSLEPDPQLQPRRRVACMAIALYATWWMQHTSGYFRWIYPLAIADVEEKKKMVERVRRQQVGDRSPLETGSATTAKKITAVPLSVKEHARFFLLLEWGGYFVGKVIQRAMSRSLSEYGLKKEIHAFISQHLVDLCTILDAHFRIYRFLLATEEPMLCDIMLASSFEFLLKDDPPCSDITDGSFRHLERFVAEVTGNGTRLRQVKELVEEDENAPFTSKRRKLKERQQRVQLFGFRNRERLIQQERQLLQEEYEKNGSSSSSSSSSRMINESSEEDNNDNTTSDESDDKNFPRRRPSPINGGLGKIQAVPFLQQTTTEDVVPETLAPLFSLMEEVFPWLQAQRNSVEDRINAVLDTGSPLGVVELPNIPSLKEFAGKRVPVVGHLPRLVSDAWEMEIENPPGAEFSHFERSSAEALAARSGQATSTIISCGTSMPHLHMTQFVAKDLSEDHCARFSSTPSPPASTRSVGGVVPISDEKLEHLRKQLVDLKLEEPWDVAPRFEDRADGEYVVFKRQVVTEADNVEVIDETREGKKKKRREGKKNKKSFFKRFGSG